MPQDSFYSQCFCTGWWEGLKRQDESSIDSGHFLGIFLSHAEKSLLPYLYVRFMDEWDFSLHIYSIYLLTSCSQTKAMAELSYLPFSCLIGSAHFGKAGSSFLCSFYLLFFFLFPSHLPIIFCFSCYWKKEGINVCECIYVVLNMRVVCVKKIEWSSYAYRKLML